MDPVIANNLTSRRRAAGLSQEALAEKLQLVEQGACLFEDVLAQEGITQASSNFTEFINQPYANLREAAFLEE